MGSVEGRVAWAARACLFREVEDGGGGVAVEALGCSYFEIGFIGRTDGHCPMLC